MAGGAREVLPLQKGGRGARQKALAMLKGRRALKVLE